MKIGVIADTHDFDEFIDLAIDRFKKLNIDVLIHCGDITKPETLKKFAGFDKFYVVKGNMDKDVEGLKEAAKEIGAKFYDDYADITLSGKHIAVLHSDDQMKFGSLIESLNYDYILYGHTHTPNTDIVNNANLVNPGAHSTNTIAIIDLDSDIVSHISLKKEDNSEEE